MRLLLVGVALVSLTQSCRYAGRPVTPQRPTVSYDTSTTAERTFELEAGLAVDPGDSFDSPTTLKYGSAPGTELFVGWSPWQVADQPGPDLDGSSDVVLGARHRLWEEGDSSPSAAVVVSAKLPTASVAGGQSTGESDVRVGAILNQRFGPVTGNAFYQYGALGDPAGGGTISEHTATLTAGWAFDDRFGGFVELAGIFVPAQDLDSIFTIVGVTYAAMPSLVIDAGVTAGLSSDAPDLQLFVGLTHNFGGPVSAGR